MMTTRAASEVTSASVGTRAARARRTDVASATANCSSVFPPERINTTMVPARWSAPNWAAGKQWPTGEYRVELRVGDQRSERRYAPAADLPLATVLHTIR